MVHREERDKLVVITAAQTLFYGEEFAGNTTVHGGLVVMTAAQT